MIIFLKEIAGIVFELTMTNHGFKIISIWRNINMDQKIFESKNFSEILFQKMKDINPGIKLMELYEFGYALKNMTPPEGKWSDIELPLASELEKNIISDDLYNNIKLKPQVENKIVLDQSVFNLTQTLFKGIVAEKYSLNWINRFFYFDIRGFIFLPRTKYFTDEVKKHLNCKPYKCFEKKQKNFESYQGVGYKDFKNANEKIDRFLAVTIEKLISKKGTPSLIGVAGPTAAGKTEFTEFLNNLFSAKNKSVTSIEMDNFFLDRDYREEKGIGSMGQESMHFNLLIKALEDIKKGKDIEIPRYDFVKAVSSHDLNGKLKPGFSPIQIKASDIVYVEGNFPFLYKETQPLIDIKLIYITDDPVRLKRKWKRDIDYRKKYDVNYFINRYFKTQYPKAKECYLPQLEVCDIAADTTNAEIWVTKEIKSIL